MVATMSDRVYIFDTTLRDGEQSPGCSMTVPEKLLMARNLVELGVDILEAGFPIASEGEYDAVTAISKEHPAARIAALARCCAPDVERAAAALSHARQPRIHLVIATSDIHLKYKLKKTQQQVLDDAFAAVELARRHVDDVEFSAEDGARTQPEFLEKIARAVVAAGARTVNIPDTVGYATPKEYGTLISRIVTALGDSAIVSTHCHDDLGLAVSNTLAAIEAGARQIECTINGIGERAGNCSLEEIVMILKTRPDSYAYHTGINTEHLYSTSQLLSSIITFGPQPNKAIVGRNAFAHEAGSTKTDTQRKDHLRNHRSRSVEYPRASSSSENTADATHSDNERRTRHDLTREELNDLYQRFTAVADHRKKGLMDEEISSLIQASREEMLKIAAQ